MTGVRSNIRANTPTPVLRFLQGEDIVLPISNNGIRNDVGSTYPGGGEAPKGLAVRQLKSHASWVKTVRALSAQCDTNIQMHSNDTNGCE